MNDTILPPHNYNGFILIEYPENRSMEIQPIEVHEALEAEFELWYYGTTNITAYIRSTLNHVYCIWDTSIFYGGEIIVQLRSSTGDLLPCQKDNGTFRVRVRDTETGLLLCNDSTTTWNVQQRRIILTYNFTQNSGSQVIEVLRDERLLQSQTVVLDTRPTPSFSLYVSLSFAHFQFQYPRVPRS